MTEPRMRVVFWGSYDLGKPRTRILRKGLKQIGVEVIEIHTDVWSRYEDKSQLSKLVIFWALLRLVAGYPLLIVRYLRAPAHDLVLVPYMGQFDVLILYFFAKLRGRPIVWDMFLSLYDTIVNDRKLSTRKSIAARILGVIEWLACRSADKVLLDTNAHADYVQELFALEDARAQSVLVGAEPEAFPRQDPIAGTGETVQILFYGQLTPLHGIETILRAALSDRGRAYKWHIIGKGQQSKTVQEMLASASADHVFHEEWVNYEKLIDAIANAHVCLGIFGGSRKAASVIPNKVYQCLAAGRTVITRASPAVTETFAETTDGLFLVEPEDPDGLLAAIEAAKANEFPVMARDSLDMAQPVEIAERLYREVLSPLTIGEI